MNGSNFVIYSNGEIIVESDSIEKAIDEIKKDYLNQEVCFGEYIDDVVICSSVENTLKLLGRLYKIMDGDTLAKLYSEGGIHVYEVDQEKEKANEKIQGSF